MRTIYKEAVHRTLITQIIRIRERIPAGEPSSTSVGNIKNSEIVNNIVGCSPTVKMKLCDVEVNCLLDTGSMVTSFTESFYRDYIEPVCTDVKNDVKLNLKAANGISIHGSDKTR